MLDYEQMAQLEETLIKDVDTDTLANLMHDLTHLIAHSAVTAIHQSEKILEGSGEGAQLDYEDMAELEASIIKDVDEETLDNIATDLTHLIAHSIVTGIHQAEKLEEE